MHRTDKFIANVYRAILFRGTESFRESTLRSLGVLIPFDGALWGSGRLEERIFHSVVTLGVEEGYTDAVEKTTDFNPVLPLLLEKVGSAVRTSDLMPDVEFFSSELYKRCVARFGIERCVTYTDFDEHSSIYTFISLYRFDRDNDFTRGECDIFARTAFHMVNAGRHALSQHIATEAGAEPDVATAICDSYGLFYATRPDFLELLQQHYPQWPGEELPMTIPEPGETVTGNGLCLTAEAYGDLYCLRLWEERPTDNLEALDREIVDSICKGMTFKEIGRGLNRAPSTIANRLYRVYSKLGVSSRAALAKLVQEG